MVKKNIELNKLANPLISVITVVYNAASSIEQTIKSVIAQKCSYEYIVIDGGSSDGTVNIVEKYSDSIAVFISEKDDGIYDAMNKGVRYARGEWVYFLGADDVLISDALGEMSKYLQNKDKIHYCNVILKSKNIVYGGEFTLNRLFKMNICHQSIFYPREILFKNTFNVKFKYLADYYLNMSLIKYWEFVYNPIVIAVYNDTGRSSVICDKEFGKNFICLCLSKFPIQYIIYRIKNTLGNIHL